MTLFLALRTTFSVLIILSIAYFTGLPGLSSVVSAIVSAVVVSTPLSDKLKSGLSNRILGTIFGGVLGLCFIFLLSQFPFFWLMIFLFIFGVGVIAYIAQKSMGFASMGMQAGFAFMIVFSPGTAFLIDGLTSGVSRLFGILYGCLIAYLVSKIIRLPAVKTT